MMKLKRRPVSDKSQRKFAPFLALFRSLNTKVMGSILGLLVATILCSYWITNHIMKEQVRESIVRRAEALTRSIASAAGYHLILKDMLALDNMVFKVKTSNPDITAIAIIDSKDEIVVHSDPSKTGTKINEASSSEQVTSGGKENLRPDLKGHVNQHLVIESPVAFMEKDLGRVRLEIDWSVLLAAQAQARRRILPFFGLLVAFGFLTSFFLSSRLTRPVRELARGVEEMKRQGRTQPLRIYSFDELGQLTTSFNEMTALVTTQKEKLAAYAQELEEAYVATIKILAAAIEARDPYTLGHSTRVSQLAVTLAQEAGLTQEEIDLVEVACLFHDVGKIRIPDSILHKKGRLEAEEVKQMKKHPEYGAEILSKAPCLYKYIPSVRHHHEWYNGQGYPDRLSGDEIPLTAAIISLADSFDAMTSDRPYRRALSWEEALEVILNNSGRQFHPTLVGLFKKIIEKRKSLLGGEKIAGLP